MVTMSAELLSILKFEARSYRDHSMGPIFGVIKECKSIVIFRDFPNISLCMKSGLVSYFMTP